MLALPMAYFHSRRTGDIQRRLEGARQVRQFMVQHGVGGILAKLQLAGALGLMTLYSPTLAGVFLLTMPLYVGPNGVALSVAQRNAGNVVAAGSELCQLARRDARPRARLLPVEADLPRFASGLPVRFFFEAFPYQRHGTLMGRLVWVSPSSMPATAGGGFFALASLDQERFTGQAPAGPCASP